MTKEEKQLLIKDLCARLPYEVKCLVVFDDGTKDIMTLKTGLPNGFGNWDFRNKDCSGCSNNFKPYLRPMSSITEEEARKIAVLSGILTSSENILSISVKEEFIDIKIDDGVCSTETRTLWFTEMPTSITLFDYLNAHHFDYRGLIPMNLALPATEDMYNN